MLSSVWPRSLFWANSQAGASTNFRWIGGAPKITRSCQFVGVALDASLPAGLTTAAIVSQVCPSPRFGGLHTSLGFLFLPARGGENSSIENSPTILMMTRKKRLEVRWTRNHATHVRIVYSSGLIGLVAPFLLLAFAQTFQPRVRQGNEAREACQSFSERLTVLSEIFILLRLLLTALREPPISDHRGQMPTPCGRSPLRQPLSTCTLGR